MSPRPHPARRLSRRRFLGSILACSAAAAGRAADRPAAGAVPFGMKPLRVAVIGCGGQGRNAHLSQCLREKLVAVVDPDETCLRKAIEAVKKYDGALDTSTIRTFTDYREMFDKMAGEIDAVTIATPNHHHALPSLLAMKLGKAVYVEKPMAHTVAEGRQMAEWAKRYRVATQMGNQGHSGEGYRRLCEYLWAGAIGPVAEVHAWTNRANGGTGPRPPTQPAPAGMHWDTWIGPAPHRDYHADLHPHEWHGWHDFGNGSLGNMGCHVLDGAFWALKLGHPTAVEVEEMTGGSDERYPVGTRIRWDFPARDDLPPVKVFWYDGRRAHVKEAAAGSDPASVAPNGGNRPPLAAELERKHEMSLESSASLFVGERGIMYAGCYGGGVRIVPEERHKAFPMPPPILPRLKGGHFADFFRACRGGGPACADFEYSARLNEMVMLGTLAMCAGPRVRIEWDGPGMRCTNRPDLNRLIQVPSREGWRV